MIAALFADAAPDGPPATRSSHPTSDACENPNPWLLPNGKQNIRLDRVAFQLVSSRTRIR
jgi:hypothetical protein